MPSLSRNTEPLLKTVGGKTNQSNASSPSSSPSSVPKPAPMPEHVPIDADPISSDSESDKAAPSPKPSPYKVPKGRTAIKGLRLGNGREKSKRTRGSAVAGTQDSGVGLSDSSARMEEGDDMGLFGDMSGPARKQRKTTSYADRGRSFAPDGKAAGRGTKSANSTPAKSLHTKKSSAALSRANSTGKAAAASKKGMPFSSLSHNVETPTLSSEHLPGECGGGVIEREERTGKKVLKTLGNAASLSNSPVPQRTIKHLNSNEISRKEGPRLKVLNKPNPSPRMQEDRPKIKRLSARGTALPQERTSKKIKSLAPMNLPPSPEDSTLGDTHQESNDCETIDLSNETENVRLSKRNPGRAKMEVTDTPSKATTTRKLKLLGSTEAPPSKSTSNKPRTGERRSARHGKNQEPTEQTKAPEEPLSPTGSDNKDLSDLSSPPASIILDDEELELNAPPAGNYEQPAKCPICEAPVDRILLEEWQGARKYMRISRQMAFCEAHKRATAREEYAVRDYPQHIDFEALPRRIEAFRRELVEVVRRERASAFRDAVEEGARRGEGRNLVATSLRDEGLTGMSVGYYGPRGRRVMEGWVTREVAKEIREVEGSDRLIGFKSVSGFIQEVLVPEVAMRLVAQDLDVGVARAREVLRESGEIGEFVHGVEEEEGGLGESADVEMEDNGDY